MKMIFNFINMLLDALFPLKNEENELFLLSPLEALQILPMSPESPIKNTYPVFHYKDKRVQKLIWNIKYKKSKRAVDIGAFAVYKKLEWFISNLAPNIKPCQKPLFLIAPIPITTKRRKERGYNQCEIILDAIQKLFNRIEPNNITNSLDEEIPQIIFEKNLLVRTVHKDRQTLKNRKDRLQGSKGIFAVNKIICEKYFQANKTAKIVLIILDDVITTGSTIKEAMIVAKNAGFTDVASISIAH